ncbi:F25B4.6 [Symbiodinium sp. CCMP2592]|nr:F25B4.6 [Symbiodinium sp. CCMP2592]
MTSTLLESEAEFLARAREIGMDDAFVKSLQAAGIKTFGKLAYICAVSPQSGDDTPLIQAVQKILSRDLTPGELPDLRRLWFEANTFALSDLKSRVERSSLDPPRELPLAERLTRLQNQKARLSGIVFTERVEPAHSLIDKIQSMVDSGTLTYLPPHKCPSRALEISSDKPSQQVTLDAQGGLKISKKHADLECDVRGELRLREAFTRRALAFDQIGLMSFAAHEAWHTYLFDSVTRDPPPGHKFTSVAQALNADRELWQILAQESRGSIKVIGGVKPPLDVFIERLQTHTRVNVCLANLPQATGGGKGDKGDRGGKADGKGDREGKGRGGRGKGRGDKGGQKRKWDDAQVDPEILQLLKEMPKDCVSRMPKTRQFLCVLFQHGKCPDQSKARCDRLPTTDAAPFAIFVELCCGSASLSHAAASQGWQVFPIDHHGNRFEPKVSCLPIDLGTLSSHRLIDDMIHQLRPLWLHFGLPCGTGSRARQLPISSALRAQGVPQPRPLRSAKFPLGLPDLKPHERLRVEAANAVYSTCVRALFAAWKVNALVTIENPARAWTWAALAALICQFARDNSCPAFADWYFELQDVSLSLCMFGGNRRKDTRLRCTPKVFEVLSVPCDGKHSHVPYGQKMRMGTWVFGTSSQTQYPHVFCRKLVRAASAAVSPALFRETTRQFRLDTLAAAGAQTLKHASLIPEFRQIVWADRAPNPDAKPLPDMMPPKDGASAGCSARPSWPVLPGQAPVDSPAPLDAPAVEKLAWSLLQQETCTQDDVLQLVNLLEPSLRSRRGATAEGLAWTCGAYVFSSQVGLHSVSRSMPHVCRLLAATVQHFAPGAVYTSLAVFDNFYGPEHVDAHNDHQFYNVIIPLSRFSNGGVRVKGQTLPVHAEPCLLQTSLPHKAMPAQGRRTVLVAFTVRDWRNLPPRDLAVLRDLHFAWPGLSDCPSNLAGEGEVGGPVFTPSPSKAWGVYHTMQEHFDLATKLEHPAESSSTVPDCIRRAIFDLATKGPEEIAKMRHETLSNIEARANELGTSEDHPITGGKCLQLFRELIEETGFPDKEVCRFMEEGVSLVGAEAPSPLFPTRPKPMRATPEQLDSQAIWRRRELLSKPPQKLSQEELTILNDETDEECRLGFLEGPFDCEEKVTERLGTSQWTPSQRFLLLQGEARKAACY